MPVLYARHYTKIGGVDIRDEARIYPRWNSPALPRNGRVDDARGVCKGLIILLNPSSTPNALNWVYNFVPFAGISPTAAKVCGVLALAAATRGTFINAWGDKDYAKILCVFPTCGTTPTKAWKAAVGLRLIGRNYGFVGVAGLPKTLDFVLAGWGSKGPKYIRRMARAATGFLPFIGSPGSPTSKKYIYINSIAPGLPGPNPNGVQVDILWKALVDDTTPAVPIVTKSYHPAWWGGMSPWNIKIGADIAAEL